MAKRSRKTLEESSYNKHMELYRCYSRLSSITLDKWIYTVENIEMYEAYRSFYKLAKKHWGIAQSVFTRVMNNY